MIFVLLNQHFPVFRCFFDENLNNFLHILLAKFNWNCHIKGVAGLRQSTDVDTPTTYTPCIFMYNVDL
jgi:hypothetical protein